MKKTKLQSQLNITCCVLPSDRFVITKMACVRIQDTLCKTCKLLQGQKQFMCRSLIVNQRRVTHKFTHVTEFPNNTYSTVYRDLHGTLEDQGAARDFVIAIKPSERALLLNELKLFQNTNNKGVYHVDMYL